MEDMQAKQRLRPILPFGLLLVFGILVYFAATCGNPYTPESQAKKLINCMNSKDAHCVAEFVTDEDLVNWGVTRENTETLIREYSVRSLKKVDPLTISFHRSEQFRGTLKFGVDSEVGQGYPVEVNLFLANGKWRAQHLLIQLMMLAEVSTYNKRYDDWGEMNWWLNSLEFYKNQGPKLQVLGFQGYYEDRTKRIAPWTEQIRRCIHWYQYRRKKLPHPEVVPLDPMEIINNPNAVPPKF